MTLDWNECVAIKGHFFFVFYVINFVDFLTGNLDILLTNLEKRDIMSVYIGLRFVFSKKYFDFLRIAWFCTPFGSGKTILSVKNRVLFCKALDVDQKNLLGGT